jgi:hypothetical protein
MEKLCNFRYVAPSTTDFCFRTVFLKLKSTSYPKQQDLDEKCLQNTDRKPGLAYQMVQSLSLGSATYHRFPLPVCIHNLKSANNSQTMTAGREMSTEHEEEIEVDLLNGPVTFIGWSYLPLIPASGPFSQPEKC